ncbi:serine protease [Flavobacterium johnsoniae]|uniref:ABC-three component system protein n=1 Tax=Flavobacterium TaxID=237 RepID=UPI0015BE1CDE|nr:MULTISPECIES: ABC-three component system protein [Flavobacterium]NWL02860.1 hypothetical protein [Flavobacterium collinsii]WET04013.1 hypothetical protein P0R33_06645 [Flavobacterium sp. YJ01]WJS94500.1 serine protease [Flavobacterium johnsoniae]
MECTLERFTVKVADGSGCLFQPLDSDYSYVLTAKHVVEGVDDLIIVRQVLSTHGEVENQRIEVLERPYFNSDPSKDVAIIKVRKVEGLELLLRSDQYLNEKEGYSLCGHPESRAHEGFSFRSNNLVINNSTEFNYIEGEVEKNVTHSEVIGQSGGGIIKKEETCFLLAGIQIRMVARDNVESLSRIVFAPLSFFDEIIAENNEKLSALFPPYFASLEIIHEEVFPLTGILLTPQKEELLKNQLKIIAKNLCEVFRVQDVLDFYKDSIIANGTDKSYVSHKQLWIAFLELISINQLSIFDRDLTFEDLRAIRKKHNLIFIDCNNWVKKLDLIMKSDLSSVDSGGYIVVSSTKDTKPTTVELDTDYVQDICSVPAEQMLISSSVTKVAEDLKIIHIYKFQKHIIENFNSFRNINVSNVKQTIIDETRGII